MSPHDISLRYPARGDLLPSLSLGGLPEGHSILLHRFSLPPDPHWSWSSRRGVCCSLLAWVKTFWFS